MDDILLVQFLLRKAGETAATISPDRKARLLKVRTTGVSDNDTVDAIKAAQEHIRLGIPGTVVDGRVSPARGYDYGGGAWIIVFLNMQLRIRFSNIWPRLQDLSDCPPQLKTKFKEVL